MKIEDIQKGFNVEAVGREIYDLIEELFPTCRSITGNGFRETMKVLKQHVPLEIHEIPSGTKVFDWVVPKEWNIKDAYVKNPKGERIIDFRKSNLHVVSYSIPVNETISLQELKDHLFTLTEKPDWIPYKTSYYKEEWGFCLSYNQFLELKEDLYEVFIDSTLKNGHLTYGELYLAGAQKEEILISCHACHPSMCNDNLSGVALATFLAKHINSISHKYSYRFLFIPGTIGAIVWLCLNETSVKKIKCGLVVTGVGDSGNITYKRSRQGNAEIDRVVEHILKHSQKDYQILDFSPYGYDERQYCSPGFNLPVGRLSRTPYGEYSEYHTSADNLDFVQPEFLSDTFFKLLAVLNVLENNRTYLNLSSKCEPQLGKRGLYDTFGSNELAMLWVLNLSDGAHTLLDIADRSGLEFNLISNAADELYKHHLLKEKEE